MSVSSRHRAIRFRSRVLSCAVIATALLAATITDAQATPPASQTVSFTSSPPSPARYGGTYTPTATASSGLPVTISLDASSTACTLNSGLVTFTAVGNCVIDANQAGSADFNPASAQQTIAVQPAPLVLTVSGNQTYGDAHPLYLVTNVQGLQLTDTPSVVQGTPSCTSSVTSNSPVGTYAITGCSGLSATNYTISYDLGNVTVKPAQLTITASGGTVTYGSAPPAITASYSGFVNGDTASSLTTAPTCSTTATSTSNVGSYPSSCSGAASSNYTISYAVGVVWITRAALAITASSGSFAYGSAVPTVTPHYTGFRNGDTAASLSTQPTCTSAATSSSAVGTYATSCSGAVSTNYNITYLSGVMTVTKAALTITASSDTIPFGGSVPEITASYTGFVNGDTAFDLITRPTCDTTATSTSPVGDYPTTCSGAVAANYDIDYVGGTLTVAGRLLTITASTEVTVYGSATPTITPSYDGFLNGDGPADLAMQPTCTTTATASSPVGTYPTTCSGASSTNYQIVYADGVVTVKKALLTVTANDASRPFNTPNAPLTFSITGFVNGDGQAAVSGRPALSTTATTTSEPGLYPINVAAGTLGATNYKFEFVDGWLTVLRDGATVVAPNISKSASLLAGKVTFKATAKANATGAAIAGVVVAFKLVTKAGTAMTCSATTDATGTATCSVNSTPILFNPTPWPFTANFTGNYDFLPTTVTGQLT